MSSWHVVSCDMSSMYFSWWGEVGIKENGGMLRYNVNCTTPEQQRIVHRDVERGGHTSQKCFCCTIMMYTSVSISGYMYVW